MILRPTPSRRYSNYQRCDCGLIILPTVHDVEKKRAKIEGLAVSLLNKHSLLDWTFHWSPHMQVAAGECNFKTREIIISTRVVTRLRLAQVRLVLAHEIGHALAGYQANHNYVWRQAVIQIGGSPKVRHHYHLACPKFFLVCSNRKLESCRQLVGQRQRKDKRAARKRCPNCTARLRYKPAGPIYTRMKLNAQVLSS